MSTFKVSIEKIRSLTPIEGADLIELATVLGWQCVVKKGEFNVGDYGVYFPIDSLLPDVQIFDFMRLRKFRVKTIRLKGQLSQGLMMPIECLLELGFNKKYNNGMGAYVYSEGTEENSLHCYINTSSLSIYEGLDVKDFIKVYKYEEPIPASLEGELERSIPSFIRKTDQERIQNFPDIFEKHYNTVFNLTEKLEGSSVTMYYSNGIGATCSRNWQFKNDTNCTPNLIAKELNIYEKIKQLNKNIAIQGELIGPAIQSNIYNLKSPQWRIFSIWDIDIQRYLTYSERMQILKNMEIDTLHVPYLGQMKLSNFKNLQEVINYADGKSSLYDTLREGIVWESDLLFGPETISFKTISNKYLEGSKL